MLWVLEVQCLLAGTIGAQLSPQDFGAPVSSHLQVSSGQLGIAGGAAYPEYSAPSPGGGGAGYGGGGGYGGQQGGPQGYGGQQSRQQDYGDQQGYGGGFGGPQGGPPMAPQSTIGYDPYGQLAMGSPSIDPNRITPRASPPAHASQFSAPPGTPGALRPDQQADSEAAAIRRRAQGSSPMW